MQTCQGYVRSINSALFNGSLRHRRRSSQRPTQREERVYILSRRLFFVYKVLEGTVIWICAAPGTRWLVDAITVQGFRTATGDDAWRLFWQILRRKHNLGFQSNFVSNMFAVTNLAHIPLFLSPMTPPNYIIIVWQLKNACQ